MFKIFLNRGLWLVVVVGIFYIVRSVFDVELCNLICVLFKFKIVKCLNWIVIFLLGCVRKNLVLCYLFFCCDIGLVFFL